MLVYTHEPYQIHALDDTEDYREQYQVVNTVTGFVEDKTPSLTNALYQCDASARALAKFLKNAEGSFNPDLQEKPDLATVPEEAAPIAEFEEITE